MGAASEDTMGIIQIYMGNKSSIKYWCVLFNFFLNCVFILSGRCRITQLPQSLWHRSTINLLTPVGGWWRKLSLSSSITRFIRNPRHIRLPTILYHHWALDKQELVRHRKRRVYSQRWADSDAALSRCCSDCNERWSRCRTCAYVRNERCIEDIAPVVLLSRTVYMGSNLHPYTMTIKEINYAHEMRSGHLTLMWTRTRIAHKTDPNHFTLLVPRSRRTGLTASSDDSPSAPPSLATVTCAPPMSAVI